jgi:hypothetical protein
MLGQLADLGAVGRRDKGAGLHALTSMRRRGRGRSPDKFLVNMDVHVLFG